MNTTNNTILLVEDDPNDVILIKLAFKKANSMVPIQVVKDGEQAVCYLAGNKPYTDRNRHPLPGLILLDLKLPRKSGLEVLEWLRHQPGLKRLPVVALTSSQLTSDINKAYELCINSYLVKPLSFDDLVEMIKTLKLYWFTFNKMPELL